MKIRHRNRRLGYTLIVVLSLTFLFTWTAGAVMNRIDADYRAARHAVSTLRAELLAEDGLSVMLAGPEAPDAMDQRIDTGNGTAIVSWVALDGGRREITSTATGGREPIAVTRQARATVGMDADGRWEIISYELGAPR